MAWLSDKPIPVDERLIIALDVPTAAEALELVDLLGGHGRFYKIGMELLTSGDFFDLLAKLHARGKKVFVDLKFFDVPATVASAVRGLGRHPATFCTIHGNDAMMRAAAEVKGPLKLLAVTALTSLDQRDLDDLGFQCDARALVLSRAKAALAAGCDGVVSSGLEVADLREHVDHSLLVVCPGIRPVGNTGDDQKRTVDVRQAFLNGADHIVVGRPIRAAADPRAAAADIQATIRSVFEKAN
ncbi:orotidine-5'-phosphate decarboxylase [Pseudofulvimonas gallinarii]|uniref:Orotidine 5'-phosphate decarboxylase n=1 Tax=Pseudofulvimonas gallinarii TaxID=634155 RepID=A0A4R3LGC4_9GAMM|nr:orotidine-5'-phosphate decarboxylase [Pseudofulvimonas gallinarii]THD13965.1 orotidine 5'-phosphate decarboxylase [Pseudofulvimonas gallinarii]